MNEATDLAMFESAWKADGPSVSAQVDLQAIREIRRWHIGAALEWVISLGAIGIKTIGAVQNPSVDNIQLTAAIWIFALTALAVSVWNRRGLTRLICESTSRFIKFKTQRREAQLRAIRFGFALWVVEMAFIASWRAGHPVAEAFGFLYLRLGFLYLRLIVAFSILIWLIWLDFQTRRELRQLDLIRTRLDLP